MTVRSDGITRAELIPPGDPRFVHERNKILLQAGSNDTIEQYRNGSVLLKSNHSAHIVGYTIRSTIVQFSGNPVRFAKLYWNQLALDATLDDTVSKHQARTNAAYVGHVVRPGATRLVTPFFNISTDYPVAIWGLMHSMLPPNFATQFMTASTIDVTLDSVVYADGLCEGADTFNLCNRINDELDGVRSVVSQVEDARRSGTDDSHILNTLAQSAARIDVGDVPDNAAHEAMVVFYRARLISDALKIREARGDEAALSWVLEKSTSFRAHRKNPNATP